MTGPGRERSQAAGADIGMGRYEGSVEADVTADRATAVAVLGQLCDLATGLGGPGRSESAAARGALDLAGQLRAYLAAVEAERDEARAERDRLAAVFEAPTWREIKAHWTAEHGTTVTAIGGRPEHPAMRVLAAAAMALMTEDGTIPPNYRTADLTIKPAGELDGVVISVAACHSLDQTPHAMRRKAEADRDRYRQGLARIAQHHPTWRGQRVNTALSRSQLIEVAFRTLSADGHTSGGVE